MKLKKFLILIFAAIGILAAAICFSSCLLPPCSHEYGDWVDEVNTCTEHTQKRTCTKCNYEIIVSLEPTKPHSYGDWEYISDSCTETDQRRYCAECNGYESRSLPPQNRHTYTVTEDTDNCIVHTQKQVCTKCEDEITLTLKSHGHKYLGGKCEYCETLFYNGDTSVLDKYNGTYGYEYFVSTSAAQAELYERIDEQVRAFHLNTDIDAEYVSGNYVVAQIDFGDLELDKDDAIKVWKTYRDDNPLYYWLSGSLTYTDSILYIITADDYAQGSVRAATNDLIYNKITEFSNKTSLDDNAYRLALAFHDAIIETINYAYDNSGKPESADWAHSIIGVFTGRGGVCESYAKTFQLLLNYKGVENIFVTGQGNKEAHAWNMVKLDDGNWYWCDLTWDDTPGWEWGISYYYFLVNDTQNVNWRDSVWMNPKRNFLYNHTPGIPDGNTANFLYPLPDRAAEKYSEDGGLTLRETFTDGVTTYAVTGYNTVQLTDSKATGAVIIPETVTYEGVSYTVISIGSIKDGLFSDMYVISEGTTSLSIPKTVKYICDGALICRALEAFTVDEENGFFCSVDGVLFTKSMKTIVSYPVAKQGEEYHIPDECVQTAHGAFSAIYGNYKFPHLSKLYLGENLREFGMCAWGSSYDNSKNSISGDVQGIINSLRGHGRIIAHKDNSYFVADDKALYSGGGEHLYAVFDMETVTEFEIPANVTSIYDGVFNSCYNLTKITVEEGNEYLAALDGILYTFDYTRIVAVPNEITGSVKLSDSVKRIGKLTWVDTSDNFYSRDITSISFGTSVKSIGATAFGYCAYLKSIYYGGTVEEWLAIQ